MRMPSSRSSGSKPVTTIGTRYFAASGSYSVQPITVQTCPAARRPCTSQVAASGASLCWWGALQCANERSFDTEDLENGRDGHEIPAADTQHAYRELASLGQLVRLRASDSQDRSSRLDVHRRAEASDRLNGPDPTALPRSFGSPQRSRPDRPSSVVPAG